MEDNKEIMTMEEETTELQTCETEGTEELVECSRGVSGRALLKIGAGIAAVGLLAKVVWDKTAPMRERHAIRTLEKLGWNVTKVEDEDDVVAEVEEPVEIETIEE